MAKRELALIALLILAKTGPEAFAADSLELVEPADINLLLDEVEGEAKAVDDSTLNLSDVEELDDLEAIRNDSEGIQFSDSPADLFDKKEEEVTVTKKKVVNVAGVQQGKKLPQIFDVGDEEQKLLDMSKLIVGKMPTSEWSEIASSSKVDQYEVQQDDWLWKISKRLFGSGFYYSKVWALNPQITNPHEIEPGMVLTFDTGDAESIPDVRLGAFSEEITEKERIEKRKAGKLDYRDFSDSEPPKWVADRKKLISQGVYFQYASEETYDDLEDIGKRALINEYEKYEPPMTKIRVREPGEEYDEAGFDKNSKISFDFSEGFFLNTFILSNIIVDLGTVDSAAKDSMFLHKHDRIFVKLDNAAKVKPGDMFSIYRPDGKIAHEVSDREGFSYTITGQIRVIKQLGELWECEIFDASDVIRRDDRITTYNSKILKVYKTFSKRMIEAGVIAGYERMKSSFAYGDVIYLDRGRIDGAELGNVFEIYSARDHYADKTISPDPAYKIGEVTVISLSDNFATALVTASKDAIPLGGIAIAKTVESAMRAQRIKDGTDLKKVRDMETKALDELDIELNLDDINEDLLDKADKIQLTDDELHELERQEREKSIIKEHEKDLKELERLESEIADAEAQLNEARVDEDKFLEQQNLDDLEMKTKAPDPDAFGSLDEIEKDAGRQYMDQDLNSKENPYGLTEFDLEEIDELLNTEAKNSTSK